MDWGGRKAIIVTAVMRLSWFPLPPVYAVHTGHATYYTNGFVNGNIETYE
jgi:hypothetical protein